MEIHLNLIYLIYVKVPRKEHLHFNFGYALDIWLLINNCHLHSFTYAWRTFEGWWGVSLKLTLKWTGTTSFSLHLFFLLISVYLSSLLDSRISRVLDNFELLVSRVDFSSRLVSRNFGENGRFLAWKCKKLRIFKEKCMKHFQHFASWNTKDYHPKKP